MRSFVIALLIGFLAIPAAARTQPVVDSDPIRQADKAATVFTEIMNAPDKGIPESILDKARCVGVFPDVVKVGFIVGGRGGRGVISCRTSHGWSSPAYFNLKGGSFGLQIGAESTDFILLFMNDKGVNSLLSSKFELGADASVAAGPVGRSASASTDVKFNAEILSYSRSKGLFAGLELKGTHIAVDKDDMKEIYGDSRAADAVLKGAKAGPASVQVFPATLAKYSTKRMSEN
jgi:lipid-binding SYLF domain-containing protein